MHYSGFRLRNPLVFLIALIAATNSHAHVRWFAEEQGQFSDVGFTLDPLTLLIAQGAILFCWLCWRLQNAAASSVALAQPLLGSLSLQGKEWRVLGPLMAVSLLANHFSGIFIAPNLNLSDCCIEQALLIQLAFILPLLVSPLLAGTAMLVGLAYLPVFVSPELVIDYVFGFGGIALALIYSAPSVSALDRALIKKLELKLQFSLATASRCLRLGLGCQLLVLAIHNKFMDPGLALMFLSENPHFNFMALLGLDSFQNIHFVFAGAVAEASFGLMLLLNYSSRLAVASVAFFFLASSLVLGPHEIIGHLPILGTAFILVLQPYGKVRASALGANMSADMSANMGANMAAERGATALMQEIANKSAVSKPITSIQSRRRRAPATSNEVSAMAKRSAA